MTTESDEQFSLADDAARSAVAILRAYRKGDHMAAMDLASSLSPVEQGNLCGAMAAMANQLMNILDQVTGNRADDVLTAIMVGFARPEELGPFDD
jgi:hypothetical protein